MCVGARSSEGLIEPTNPKQGCCAQIAENSLFGLLEPNFKPIFNCVNSHASSGCHLGHVELTIDGYPYSRVWLWSLSYQDSQLSDGLPVSLDLRDTCRLSRITESSTDAAPEGTPDSGSLVFLDRHDLAQDRSEEGVEVSWNAGTHSFCSVSPPPNEGRRAFQV